METAACIHAIHSGDPDALRRLLAANPALATLRIHGDGGQRTLLHIATDWPGHFPRVRQTIDALVAHGADVNAPFIGHHSETPLHWAASSNDLEALDALLDHHADIEAPGAVIGGGSPLADAVAFACWPAAHRLVARGAQTTLWQAAALGLLDRLELHLAAQPAPDAHAITNAFWNACHGSQLPAAQRLLAHAPDLNWIGHDHLTPLDAALRQTAPAPLLDWLRQQGARSAQELR